MLLSSIKLNPAHPFPFLFLPSLPFLPFILFFFFLSFPSFPFSFPLFLSFFSFLSKFLPAILVAYFFLPYLCKKPKKQRLPMDEETLKKKTEVRRTEDCLHEPALAKP
jgi:amino acid permease